MNPFPINHDLHVHTTLSSCCEDPELTSEYIFNYATKHNYDRLAITNHYWDASVPGAIGWYAPQDLDHIKKLLPLPDGGSTRFLFGCETEYCGGTKIGIPAECYNAFDFIIVPLNHFHMKGFVRPEDYETSEERAELFTSRLEQLCEIGLPWHKVGIAHINCRHMGDVPRILELVPESRIRNVFRYLGANGTGIELSGSSFSPGWKDNADSILRLFKIAQEEKCKFYCGSDAHIREGLDSVANIREVADLLGLTEDDLFIPS